MRNSNWRRNDGSEIPTLAAAGIISTTITTSTTTTTATTSIST